MLPPSMKKGRFSSSFTSKAVRLTNAGSKSTWPKSGFTVASRVRFEVTLYLRSAPTPPRYALPRSKGSLGESGDRKSTRLNSSHSQISYAVFCLKKKKQINTQTHTTTQRPSNTRQHTLVAAHNEQI